MLTKRQNLLETIRGGKPDRFVNQYESLAVLLGSPYAMRNPMPAPGQMNVKNAWGVVNSWPEGHPGLFPNHSPENIVIKDMECWRDYVKAPNVVFPEEEWAPFVAQAEAVDRSEQFAAFFMAPGIFEMCHHLQSLEECLCNFYEYPDEMHELIDFLADWEIAYAKEVCKYLKPDALFHHDDWGSKISTFISPEMFREFIKPAYKKIYSAWRELGVELIIHHGDSYAATLVPDMIDVGIDIWQGALVSNDVPALVRQYGGKISFMGGIETEKVEHDGWTREDVKAEVRRACTECGSLYYIPCICQGLPGSVYPGVYEAISEEIDSFSGEYFK